MPRIGALEHDLRLYEQEFDTFELDNGYYPTSVSTPGVFPMGMEDRMSAAWKFPSPIGGCLSLGLYYGRGPCRSHRLYRYRP